MNTKNTRKGFTTVELVIVIAVIAILATVLIPTFSNLIEKANLSVDTQNVRNMNVCLATYITADDPSDFGMVKERLKEFGYGTDNNFAAKAKGHSLRWYAKENVILLVNDQGKAVFPEEYKGTDASNIRMFFDLNVPATVVDIKLDRYVDGVNPLDGTELSNTQISQLYTFTPARPEDTNEKYETWYADFFISFENSDGTDMTDYDRLSSIYFGGFYDGWSWQGGSDQAGDEEENWLIMPVAGPVIDIIRGSEGKEIALIGTITETSQLSYQFVRDGIGVFKCGVADNDGGADASIKMFVELRLTNPQDANDHVIVGMYEYTFK